MSLLALWGACVGAQSRAIAQGEPPPLTDRQRQELAYHAESLRAAQTTPESRVYAAQLLVRMQVPQAVAVLDEGLRSGNADLAAAIIRGIEAEGAAPAGLLDSIALTLKGASPQRAQAVAGLLARYGERGSTTVAEFALDASNDPAVRLGAIRALGDFRTTETVRASVDALIRLIQPGRQEPATVVDAAFLSLERLTSLDNLGRDANAWADWWALMHDAPVANWLPVEVDRLSGLLEALRQEAAGLRAENDNLTRRLDEVLRDHFFTLIDLDPTRQRALSKLAELTSDALPAVRRWAINRADRLVSDAQPVSDGVVTAIAARIKDETPDIRLSAARLIHKMNHPQAAELLAAALAAETVADNRLGLLEVLSRRGAPDATPALIALLGEPATRDAAAPALLRVVADNLLPETHRPEALAAVRAAFETGPSKPVIRLLAAIGESTDLDAIIPLLDHPDAAMRACAAESLRGHPSAARMILDRAGDSSIFPSAVHVLAGGAADMHAFESLLALEVPAADQHKAWRDGIARLAGRLPVTELAAADTAIQILPESRLPGADGLVLRESIVARIMTTSSDSAPEETRLALFLDLARLRSQLGQHDGVLAALDRMNGTGSGLGADARRLRFDTLLRMGRYDDAVAVAPAATDWIAALERLVGIDVKSAAAVKAEIERRFPTLDEASQAQLAAIAARLQRSGDGASEGGGAPRDLGGSTP